MRNLLEPQASLSPLTPSRPSLHPSLPYLLPSLPYQTPSPPPTSLRLSCDFITEFKFSGINRPFLFSYISFPLFTYPSASFPFFPSVSSLASWPFLFAFHRKAMLYGRYIENRVILNNGNIDLFFFLSGGSIINLKVLRVWKKVFDLFVNKKIILISFTIMVSMTFSVK